MVYKFIFKGKITDYITKNNFQQKNTYQIIDIRDSLG